MRKKRLLLFLGFAFTKQGYFIYLIVGILFGSLAYYLNSIIPKPETFWVLCKYLFGFAGKYLGTILVNLIAFVSVLIVGLATIIGSIKELRGYEFFGDIYYSDQYETPPLRLLVFSILAIAGLVVIVLSFIWYFYYASLLIGVLLVLGIIGLIAMWLLDQK